jgi:hypothetical protein
MRTFLVTKFLRIASRPPVIDSSSLFISDLRSIRQVRFSDSRFRVAFRANDLSVGRVASGSARDRNGGPGLSRERRGLGGSCATPLDRPISDVYKV